MGSTLSSLSRAKLTLRRVAKVDVNASAVGTRRRAAIVLGAPPR